MGIYLNPGSDGFEESIRSEIYVDKTGLIACTNGLINTKENISVSAQNMKKQTITFLLPI